MRPDITDLLTIHDLRVEIFQVQMHLKCLKKTFGDISTINNITICSVYLQISTAAKTYCQTLIHSTCDLSAKKVCVCEMIIHYVCQCGEECVKSNEG